jgi:3-oxoacyl-[acyl-carrier protein] reductase
MATLEGKKAVVAGGSRGIGRAIVERLARDGADVVFCYASRSAAAAEVERSVAGGGRGSATGLQADLSDAPAVKAFLQLAERRLGGLDILVYNAVALDIMGTLAELDEAVFARALAVSATAPFLALRHASRRMSDNGRIITISTLNTVAPARGAAAYVAGKGALEQLTKSAAVELGARGITANIVSPGATDTELLRGVNSAEDLAAIPALTPLGRLGTASDIADVVAFLAGPDGRWITGQNIPATGGLLG